MTHRCVKKLIKVLVVAEDDMATHVKEEAFWRAVRARKTARLVRLAARVPVLYTSTPTSCDVPQVAHT
jgi:hypothetical protein